MPIYNYKCKTCSLSTEQFVKSRDEVVNCKCGSQMDRVFTPPVGVGMSMFPVDGIFLKHVSREGKRFFSKREMRDYAKKHDLTIGYLEE